MIESREVGVVTRSLKMPAKQVVLCTLRNSSVAIPQCSEGIATSKKEKFNIFNLKVLRLVPGSRSYKCKVVGVMNKF
jgi:hypothetical protein